MQSITFPNSIPDIVSYNDVTTNTPADIGNLFGSCFSKCFNRNDVSVIPDYDVSSVIRYPFCYPTETVIPDFL